MNAVQTLEAARHRLLRDPRDDLARAALLEALASYTAVPLASFPDDVLDLVEKSHEQADALGNRILAGESLSDPWIDQEVRAACSTVASVAAASRESPSLLAPGQRAAAPAGSAW